MTSRKFLIAVAGVITGICGLFGWEDNLTQISGIAASVACAVIYIISESSIDRESLFSGIECYPASAEETESDGIVTDTEMATETDGISE